VKKYLLYAVAISIIWITLYLIPGCKESKRSSAEGHNLTSPEYPVQILSQEKDRRVFSSENPEIVTEINFEELKNPPFKPNYLHFDKYGAFYTVDFHQCLVHKFSPSPDWKHFQHIYFGEGRGQGPGEFSQILDFKIYLDNIYLVDEGKGAIEVYSTDGAYKGMIRLNNGLIPRKITFFNSKMIVEAMLPDRPLFYAYDLDGNFLYSFGELIEKKNQENKIYHDNYLSDCFSENCFYYLPRFFGFVALYRDSNLILVKETIDGLIKGKENEAVNKVLAKGISAQTVKKKHEIVYDFSLYRNFILIRAYDYENKNSFLDLYSSENFDYLLSIKNPPGMWGSFAIWENLFAVLIETDTGSKVGIYDIAKIIKEASSKPFYNQHFSRQ